MKPDEECSARRYITPEFDENTLKRKPPEKY